MIFRVCVFIYRRMVFLFLGVVFNLFFFVLIVIIYLGMCVDGREELGRGIVGLDVDRYWS